MYHMTAGLATVTAGWPGGSFLGPCLPGGTNDSLYKTHSLRPYSLGLAVNSSVTSNVLGYGPHSMPVCVCVCPVYRLEKALDGAGAVPIATPNPRQNSHFWGWGVPC